MSVQSGEWGEHFRRIERWDWLQWRLWDGRPQRLSQIGRPRGITKGKTCVIITEALHKIREAEQFRCKDEIPWPS